MLEDFLQCTTFVSLCVALIVLLLVCYVHLGFHGTRTEPPGPTPLPLLGNLLQVDLKRLDKTLFDLSKTYGPVFTVYLGLKKVVVLAGYKTVRLALVNHAEEFGDRDIMPIFYDFDQEHGVIFSNGDSWKEMRRFALTTLRDFGMGKKLTESQIVDECHYLIEAFEKQEGKAFDNTQAISYAASNVISSLVFGKRFDFEDPRYQAIVEKDHEAIRLTGSTSILVQR